MIKIEYKDPTRLTGEALESLVRDIVLNATARMYGIDSVTISFDLYDQFDKHLRDQSGFSVDLTKSFTEMQYNGITIRRGGY